MIHSAVGGGCFDGANGIGAMIGWTHNDEARQPLRAATERATSRQSRPHARIK